jgi:hypothetical protein
MLVPLERERERERKRCDTHNPHPEEGRVFAARLEGWPLVRGAALALRDAPKTALLRVRAERELFSRGPQHTQASS